MTLGQRIRTARIGAGLTSQLKLAQACGWDSASRIGNYEQDSREPSLEDLRSIAAATQASGYSYSWLVLGPDELGSSHATRLDPAKLAESIEALRRLSRDLGFAYDPVQHAALTSDVYELRCAIGAEPSTAEVIDFGAKVTERLRMAAGGR